MTLENDPNQRQREEGMKESFQLVPFGQIQLEYLDHQEEFFAWLDKIDKSVRDDLISKLGVVFKDDNYESREVTEDPNKVLPYASDLVKNYTKEK